ncbi:MAG TPA: ATP-binding protein [Flavitalea sp.]|nr:ATP-binding protein [Flavitalea sp.]
MILKKQRLRIITIVYWLLLVYIVAALVWWFIELENQNRQMANYKLSELRLDDPGFNQKMEVVESARARKTTQYISEGSTFLALIIIVAVFMYRAIRRQFTLQIQQENFMMAVTHELKTPIAIAKLNLETLQKHQLDEEKRHKLLNMTVQEINRLNSLATNILVSAQLEAGSTFAKEELNFSDLVKRSATDYMHRYPERRWTIDVEDEVEVKGDALLLEILVNNLLENSVKYSETGTPITCSLKKEAQVIILQVRDVGPGIPAGEKRKIFRKFYRLGNEEVRSTKGTGLGLYLCKKIAADHHAVIRIEDNHPQGSVFVIKFAPQL